LLVHPGIYVFPVLVQQLAVELLLPVPRGNSAQEKGLEFAKHGVHLLSAGAQQDKAQGICGMTNKAIWFAEKWHKWTKECPAGIGSTAKAEMVPKTEALRSPTKKQVLNYGVLRNRQDSARPGRWLRKSAKKAGLSS
jgi:hypothetical protein